MNFAELNVFNIQISPAYNLPNFPSNEGAIIRLEAVQRFHYEIPSSAKNERIQTGSWKYNLIGSDINQVLKDLYTEAKKNYEIMRRVGSKPE